MERLKYKIVEGDYLIHKVSKEIAQVYKAPESGVYVNGRKRDLKQELLEAVGVVYKDSGDMEVVTLNGKIREDSLWEPLIQ